MGGTCDFAVKSHTATLTCKEASDGKTNDELNENSEKNICMTVWLSHFISVLYDRLSLTLI